MNGRFRFSTWPVIPLLGFTLIAVIFALLLVSLHSCAETGVGGGDSDSGSQLVTITKPTTDETYTTSADNVIIGGTAYDTANILTCCINCSERVGVSECIPNTSVAWSNDATGESGYATGHLVEGECINAFACPIYQSWQAGVCLAPGENPISVTASTAKGQGSDSITVTFNHDGPIPFPSPPTGVEAAVVRSDQITLNWEANPADEHVNAYTLYMAETPWTTWTGSLPGAKRTEASCCTKTLTGLTYEKTYWFSITASSCGERESEESEQVSATLEFVPQTDVENIAAGESHTCLLTSSGEVKCWGSNSSGQLGDGTTTSRLTPVEVVGLTSGVTAITAGRNHTCALTTSGGVKCWGNNEKGKLGDGTTTTRLTPVNVVGLTSGISEIAVGAGHTCALTTSGGVKCWGSNSSGQLGDGTTTSRLTPVEVVGLTSGVKAITAGRNHTCALTTSGGLKCWGENGQGQLGNFTTTDSVIPVFVTSWISGVTAISAGETHTCALTTSGGVICWGGNDNGQLGDGTLGYRLNPVQAAGLTIGLTGIAAGGNHTCALTISGGVKCWGDNSAGKLGDGTATDRLTPVDVVGLASGVAAIAAGGGHTCALPYTGVVKCWGSNVWGQLGDGTTTSNPTPVDVILP